MEENFYINVIEFAMSNGILFKTSKAVSICNILAKALPVRHLNRKKLKS